MNTYFVYVGVPAGVSGRVCLSMCASGSRRGGRGLSLETFNSDQPEGGRGLDYLHLYLNPGSIFWGVSEGSTFSAVVCAADHDSPLCV